MTEQQIEMRLRQLFSIRGYLLEPALKECARELAKKIQKPDCNCWGTWTLLGLMTLVMGVGIYLMRAGG